MMDELKRFERRLKLTGFATFAICISFATLIAATTESQGWSIVQNVLWGVAGMSASWMVLPTIWALAAKGGGNGA